MSSWALWREGDHVYVREQTVLPVELETPFDPDDPHPHVGTRVAMSELGLPIAEWRMELVHLLATAFGIRWPIYHGRRSSPGREQSPGSPAPATHWSLVQWSAPGAPPIV
jgi:hypothetical protein